MKRKFQAVKGTRDILPPESALWNRVEQTARQVLGSYNYQEIRLPLFEETEVFARSVGADTDIVAKEMYSFEDRDGTSVSLRPEATASVVRAYIEHGMHTLPGLVKLYYLGPMFRRERPQKGRYRQFYQIGAEVLGGSDHPAIDAEVIEMVLVFIERCGLKGAELFVNSIGCGDCRPKYVALLKNELERVKSSLGPDSQRRIETNPLRVLDSKLEEEQPIIAKLPSILDHLCDACRSHFEKVKQELKERNIAFALNHRLVRGLDYYMRTTFEITAPGLGSQNAVCGGGRYDGLVELLGGPPTKGIGWALGTDRLILALERSESVAAEKVVDALVVWLGERARPRALEVTRRLRHGGLSVEFAYEEMKVSKALNRAHQIGARWALIIGEDELNRGQYSVRILKPFEEAQERDWSVAPESLPAYGRLVKLRVELERALKSWAAPDAFFGKTVTLSQIVDYLIHKQKLPAPFASTLRDLIPSLNRAAHGEPVDRESLEWAVLVGNLLIDEINRLERER